MATSLMIENALNHKDAGDVSLGKKVKTVGTRLLSLSAAAAAAVML